MQIRTFAMYLLFSLSFVTFSIQSLATEINTPITTSQASSNDLENNPLAQTFGKVDWLIKGLIETNPEPIARKLLTIPEVINALQEKLKKDIEDPAKEPSLEAFSQLILTYVSATDYIIKIISSSAPDKEADFALPTEFAKIEDPEELVKLVISIDEKVTPLLAKINETMIDTMGAMLTDIRRQLSDLELALQIMINKVNASTRADKAAIKENIMEMRKHIQLIYRTINNQAAAPQLLRGLNDLIEQLVTHILDAHKNKLTTLGELPEADEQAFKKRMSQQVSLNEIGQDVQKNRASINKLLKTVENADISWITKTARFMGDYVVNPISRHKLEIFTLGLGAGIAGYLWYLSGNDSSSLAKWVRNFKISWISKDMPLIGYSKEYNPYTSEPLSQSIVNKMIKAPLEEAQKMLDRLRANPGLIKPVGLLGETESRIIDYLGGRLPTLTVLVPLFGICSYQLWERYDPTSMISAFFNYIRGGGYLRQALKDESLTPTVTFNDIVGMEAAKDAMLPLLKYLENIDRWDAAEIAPPFMYLLTGNTRAGKTYFARGLRGEAMQKLSHTKFQFKEYSHEDIMRYGIDNLLEYARLYLAPCIIFIDEIHLLHLQDTGNSAMLTKFLTAMSGLDLKQDPKKPVILIAATNKPENISNALRQKGRFGVEIRFEYPSSKERKEYLIKKFAHEGIDPEYAGIDIDQLVIETEQCTYEKLAGIISALKIHVNIKGGVISQELLEQVIDNEIRHIVPYDNQEVPEAELRFMASHWAGGILAADLLGYHKKIAKVTINKVVVPLKEEAMGQDLWRPAHTKQTGISRGHGFIYNDNDTLHVTTNAQALIECKVYLAMQIAQEIIMGSTSNYWNGIKQFVFEEFKNVLADGLTTQHLPKDAQKEINAKAFAMLKSMEQEVKELLLAHKDKLTAIADALYKKRTLNRHDIAHLLGKQIVNTQDKKTIDDELAALEQYHKEQEVAVAA